MCDHFNWGTMHETKEFAVQACKPLEVDVLNDLGSCCLRAVLVCLVFVFSDELFVLYNLLQTINFIGTDCSQDGRGFWGHKKVWNR